MGLGIAHHNINAFGALLEARLKHGVGFAHASGCAKEDFEFAARALGLLGLHAGQQLVGIWTVFHIRNLSPLPDPPHDGEPDEWEQDRAPQDVVAWLYRLPAVRANAVIAVCGGRMARRRGLSDARRR